MGNIYLAVSEAFPDQFKIGRTGRDVEVRMNELSADDYGPSGFVGDADWNTHAVFEVEDEIAAETLLHEHFQADRLEAARELFLTDNVGASSEEVLQVLSSESLLLGFSEIIDIGATGTVIAGAAILTASITLFAKRTSNEDLAADIASWMDAKERAFNQWGQKQKKPLLHLPQRKVHRLVSYGVEAGKKLSDESLLEDERVRRIVTIGREKWQQLENRVPSCLKKVLSKTGSLEKKKSGEVSQFVYDKDFPVEVQRLIEELEKRLKR